MWNEKILTIEKKGRPTIALALIEGFNIKGLETKIGPILIRNFNKKDEVHFNDKSSNYDHVILEFKYLDRKEARSMYCEPAEIINRSFYSLQLLVDGWIGMSEIIHFDENHEQVGKVVFTRNNICDAHISRKIEVNSDSKKFIENFKFLYEHQEGLLKNTIKRYGKGNAETALESIVDFMIVLEATLGYKLNIEISHRIASRGAMLLAENNNERYDYYKVLKYLYKIRSGIVHGNLGEVKAMNDNIRQRFENLGFLNDEAGDSFYKRYEHYTLADISRKIARKTLLFFIFRKECLDEEWLTKLELNCYKK